MTRDEILVYLDSIRKPDMLDPLHKWIGTYNLRRTILLRFFKWFYFPNEEPKRRKIPAAIENIPRHCPVNLTNSNCVHINHLS
jgi:integrase/recombinase XerD